MDIQILRDGQQIGPFSEETVQSLLKQGNILINDLAWRPGMPQWLPLHAVLYPAAQPTVAPPPPPAPIPEPGPAPVAEAPVSEPPTQRQRAFLTFMAVPFGTDLTKEKAAMLVNEAMENPKLSGRLKRWEDERLRLYPELFAEEIKARRENRAVQYFEICQAEGAEFFEGVTKAHTQVLVGYLDVTYPGWGENEQSAKYDYLFPAISEKFPQVVKRSAKGKFKYPNGPKVAAELVGGRPTRPLPKKSPAGAMFRGLFFGLLVLGLLIGYRELEQRGGIEKLKSLVNPPTPRPKLKLGPEPVAESMTSSQSGKFAAVPSKNPDAGPSLTAPTTKPPTAVAASDTTTPSAKTPKEAETMAANPAQAEGDATMAAPSPATLPANVSLFDSTPPPTVPPPPEGTTTKPAPAPTAATPRVVTAKITKATAINLRFGSSTLRPGTPVQVVAANGATLTIKFGPETVNIPAANTDYVDSTGVPAPSAP